MNSNDLLLEVLFKDVLSSIHSTPSSKDESWTINPTNEWPLWSSWRGELVLFNPTEENN